MSEESVSIYFRTGSAAFEDSPTGEIARILRALADDFESSGLVGTNIYDINGNYVGEVEVISEGND